VSRTVLITGAGGNIGSKLRAHFSGLGWALRLPDVATRAMTPRPIWRIGTMRGCPVCRATKAPASVDAGRRRRSQRRARCGRGPSDPGYAGPVVLLDQGQKGLC
jgi:hypothetical protein